MEVIIVWTVVDCAGTPPTKPAVWTFNHLTPAFKVLWAGTTKRIVATSSEKASILQGR